MGYRPVDEWENFEFQDADVGQIHMENGHLYYVQLPSEEADGTGE